MGWTEQERDKKRENTLRWTDGERVNCLNRKGNKSVSTIMTTYTVSFRR